MYWEKRICEIVLDITRESGKKMEDKTEKQKLGKKFERIMKVRAFPPKLVSWSGIRTSSLLMNVRFVSRKIKFPVTSRHY